MFETPHSQREKQTYRSDRDEFSISFYFYKHQCPDGTVVHPMHLRTENFDEGKVAANEPPTVARANCTLSSM
jgi:hypothetical protein